MTSTVDPELLPLHEACRGRFAIERELGRGGMGIVVLARDLALDRPVAIKLLPPVLARVPSLRERFLREARTAAGLAHPNIVPIHAVEAHGDVVFFVMGYVDGETLGRRIARGGPLPVADAVRVLRDVAWALAYAHGRGVVHRDVKPDNVLLDRGSGRALVTDFGIARVEDAPSGLTSAGHVLGTAHYMSPEQAAGELVDGRSDLYALGVTGFHALTGTLPFEANTAAALLAARLTRAAPPVGSRRSGLAPRLAAAVDRCLAAAPADRFPSAEALADALADVEARSPIPPQVRNFMRMAEQTTLLLWMVTAVMLPSLDARRGGALAAAFGLLAAYLGAGLDLGRRARGLLRDGYAAGDVIRAFVVEREARDEEVAALYQRHDPKRHARRRWVGLAILAVVGAAFVGLLALADTLPVGSTERRATRIGAMLQLVLGSVLGFALINTSPQTERRLGAGVARLWRSAFTIYFFRLAGIGLHREAEFVAPATPPADTQPELPLPDIVRGRFPGLPAVVAAGDALLRTLSDREEALERMLAEAPGAIPAPGPGSAPIQTTRAHLAARRVSLLADIEGALSHARERRAELLDARENLRFQLARLGAGLVVADALAPDVDALTAAVDAAGRSDAGRPAPAIPLPPRSAPADRDGRIPTPR